jgi:hypothetical protein
MVARHHIGWRESKLFLFNNIQSLQTKIIIKTLVHFDTYVYISFLYGGAYTVQCSKYSHALTFFFYEYKQRLEYNTETLFWTVAFEKVHDYRAKGK